MAKRTRQHFTLEMNEWTRDKMLEFLESYKDILEAVKCKKESGLYDDLNDIIAMIIEAKATTYEEEYDPNLPF